MMVVGLTGSIGMGKTTTASMFKDMGVPVWDADSAVHRLYACGGVATKPVGDLFPDAVAPDGSIDRDILSKRVLNDRDKLKTLESVVHPLVGQDRAVFMAQARATNAPIAIADVPLLFETGGNAFVDKVIVVTCDAALQRQRVLERAGMSVEKFETILARQTPDHEKRARADFVITTDISLDDTREQVGKIYAQLLTLDMDRS
jgi:dephospho-CoA kinase